MSEINLKNYVCSIPFTSLRMEVRERFLCCPTWLEKFLPDDATPYDAWNSQEAIDIRDSILDGSFKYCNSIQCPHLHQLKTFGKNKTPYPLYNKKNIPVYLEEKIKKHEDKEIFSPSVINFSMDRSCNLKCPSCRLTIYIANSKEITKIKDEIQTIQDTYGDEVETLYITVSGDPFISVPFRDFLRNFDISKWKKIKNIHLHTNATRWNKKMWDSMPNIHKYVKSCEISIDAATKDTYENKVRLDGNWDELIENLNFISKIPNLKNVKTSFVVQQKNYKEMKQFYDLMYSIFGNKVDIFYNKITNWGTFTEEDFLLQQIWNESHSEYNEFVKEVNSFLPNNHSWSNLQEFITPVKTLI
jgi:hypothetical protein